MGKRPSRYHWIICGMAYVVIRISDSISASKIQTKLGTLQTCLGTQSPSMHPTIERPDYGSISENEQLSKISVTVAHVDMFHHIDAKAEVQRGDSNAYQLSSRLC